MATKFLNLSTDTTLGGVSPSDEIAVSQKAIKTYVDNQGGGGSGTLAGLSDVTLTSPTDGQVLTYDNGDWVNADSAGGYHPDLFSWQWADHQLNDVQWLRADTFSWQSGAVYQTAYQHLADDYNNTAFASITILNTGTGLMDTYDRYSDGDITGYYAWTRNGVEIYTTTQYPTVSDSAYTSLSPVKTTSIASVGNPTSETIAGVTITYYLADDGHKICPASEESNVAAIYTATGVAWYYILDTTNQRFKLPRTKFGFTGLRDTVGKYVAAGLPNITGSFSNTPSTTNAYSGAFRRGGDGQTFGNGNDRRGSDTTFDASLSNSIYGASNTVQPPATEMYLYFYVGNFTQTALENTAGVTTEVLNDKVDLSSSWGAPSSTYDNLTVGASGATYVAPADGWVTASGQATGNGGNISLLNQTAGELKINSLTAQASGWGLSASIPVRKGDVFSLIYNAATVNTLFRFVYAQKTN